MLTLMPPTATKPEGVRTAGAQPAAGAPFFVWRALKGFWGGALFSSLSFVVLRVCGLASARSQAAVKTFVSRVVVVVVGQNCLG